MLDALKRLLSRRHAGPDWTAVETWANVSGYGFKRVRDADGFVIDGRAGSQAWRMEVGPPQRDYIEGLEIRLRCDTELPSELQMLVLSRSLMQSLESDTFEQFTDSLQTYADESAPEEMRWLVMLPKLDAAALGPLKPRFAAVALAPATVEAWIGGVLGRQLLHATTTLLGGDPPFVLMTNRGRVTLRSELVSFDGGVLAGWIGLFEAALQRLPAAVAALPGHQPQA